MPDSHETTEAFRQIAIEEASRDERLCRLTEWLLTGSPHLLDEFQQDMWVDEDFALDDVGTRYELSQEDARLAMTKAEERIFERLNSE